MSDDDQLNRRSVLKQFGVGAAGAAGFLAAGVDMAHAKEAETEIGTVRAYGGKDPHEMARKLQESDEFEQTESLSCCYTETKCGSGCIGNGTVLYRECCPCISGCGECCEPWNDTGNCC